LNYFVSEQGGNIRDVEFNFLKTCFLKKVENLWFLLFALTFSFLILGAAHRLNPRGLGGLQFPHFEVGVANAFQSPEFKDISEILLCS
jgi:hypothetical protein